MVVGVVSMEEKGRMVGDDASDGHGYVVICASTFIDDALIRSEVNVAWTFILYNTYNMFDRLFFCNTDDQYLFALQ